MSPEEIEVLLANLPDGPGAEELRRQLLKEKTEEEDRLRRERNAQMQAEYDHRVQAVLETAMAFYRRGEWQQYDSLNLTYAPSRYGNPGSRRATDHVSPEDATANAVKYLVCSSFIYNVYYDAIGWKLCGEPDRCICKYHYDLPDGAVVYRWNENDGESVEDAIENIRRILRPGDIFTSSKKTDHTVLYVGDCLGDGVNYVLHAWGGKYKMATGKEYHENKGTVRLQSIEELCFTEGNKTWYKENKIPRWSMYDGMYRAVVVRPLRPWREAEYPLTASARARLEHPGLNIVRTADAVPYRTVSVGSEITYKVWVENHSKDDYKKIAITEIVPQNAELLDASGAAIDGNVLNWTVDIPAGGAAAVSWKVKVCGGDFLVSEGGNVAGIRSNKIVIQVANAPSAEWESKLLALSAESVDTKATGTIFCNEVYQKYLGKDIQLPAIDALVGQMIEKFAWDAEDEPCVCFRKTMGERLDKIRIPHYWGGRQLIIPTSERILEFDKRYLMAGDILIYAKDPLADSADFRVYLYLGEGRFLISGEDGVRECGEEILWPAFAEDFFVALRPSLVI